MAASKKTTAIKKPASSSWMADPAVRAAAAGLATALLTKLATNMTERYPQIAQLMHEGLNTLESRNNTQQ